MHLTSPFLAFFYLIVFMIMFPQCLFFLRIQQRSRAIEERNRKLKENCKQRRLELLASTKYQVLLGMM